MAIISQVVLKMFVFQPNPYLEGSSIILYDIFYHLLKFKNTNTYNRFDMKVFENHC